MEDKVMEEERERVIKKEQCKGSKRERRDKVKDGWI